MIVWCNGDWADAAAATLSPADRGFLLGDGLFETMLWDGAVLCRFGRHMQRLRASAEALKLPEPPPDAALHAIALDVLARNALRAHRAAVRVTWSAGAGARGLPRPERIAPTLLISCAPSPKPEAPAVVITASFPRNAGAPSARFKTLSSIDNVMARGEAAAAGADEALMLNGAGGLAGGAACNVFLVLDGVARTPEVAHGALPGTVRQALLEAGLEIETAILTRADMGRAEAACITNALQEVRPVSRLDGRALDAAHPAIARLRQAL
ncbi:MAG TPA: aminotransferase class IV [Caulobacterales bacterium]|nr:aminotransferase class IV [Caulobacterales bacterium]